MLFFLLVGLSLLLLSCVQDTPTTTGRSDSSLLAPTDAQPTATLTSPWTDPSGDVTLANADIVAGTIVVGGGTVELRVQFAAPPFPSTATHFIDWCIDLDQNASTGDRCGAGQLIGADAAVDIQNVPGHPIQLTFFPPAGFGVELDPSEHLTVDAATNTVRVCFADSLLGHDAEFHYIVVSIFGGSGGANDFAPQTPGFGVSGNAFANEMGAPASCCPQVAATCDAIAAVADVDCPCAGPWRSHGEYVACVARTVNRELDERSDCITGSERARISSCVLDPRAQSSCGQAHSASTPTGLKATMASPLRRQ
jgi:hypothetical protein